MRFVCWIFKETHTWYLTHITLPRQHGLPERASVLRYTFIARLKVLQYGLHKLFILILTNLMH